MCDSLGWLCLYIEERVYHFRQNLRNILVVSLFLVEHLIKFRMMGFSFLFFVVVVGLPKLLKEMSFWV